MADTTSANGAASTKGRQPNLSKNTLFFVLIVTILLLYCAPLIVIAGVYIENIGLETPLDEGDAVVAWFIKFAEGQERHLNQVHKILIPLITFIAAASFATARDAGRTLFLALMILFFFFLAIGMQVAFDASLAEKVASVSPFFTRLEETLIIYLMLILGLQSAERSSDTESEKPRGRPSQGAAPPKADKAGAKKNEEDLHLPQR
jgi:hypothetical protein